MPGTFRATASFTLRAMRWLAGREEIFCWTIIGGRDCRGESAVGGGAAVKEDETGVEMRKGTVPEADIRGAGAERGGGGDGEEEDAVEREWWRRRRGERGVGGRWMGGGRGGG